MLAGVVREELDGLARPLADARVLFERLGQAGGLAAWLRERNAELPSEVAITNECATLSDAERDLAKIELGPLWLKCARLSAHPEDPSVRLRVSFGREEDDDASRDEPLHAAVAGLARAVLPAAQQVSGAREILSVLEPLAGGPLLFTQQIAYWNAPKGGALFHHDAFGVDASDGQLGVCYVQLDGRTFWLALSIDDLALRAREFIELLARGEAPWVREELCPSAGELERWSKLASSWTELRSELARPGCGDLATLVNHGPEFTALLVDAGHGAFLKPLDALVLPNHGYTRTAMHSVFCASPRPTYALSMAIRRLC